MVFRNLDGTFVDKGFSEVLKWKLRLAAPGEVREEFLEQVRGVTSAPRVENDGSALAKAERSALSWIGHASFLVQLGGCSILIDPIFSTRLFAVRRLVAPGLSRAALPHVDALVITHNHRDHMDAASLVDFARRERQPVIIAPKGLGGWFAGRGFSDVRELGWWEHTDLGSSSAGDVRITFVPAQHWSQRGALDRNTSLWGGYVFEDGTHRVYHSGDTAYFEGFVDIGKKLGRLDAAMLPIGAYEPRWFMRPQHMNPEDAVQAFLDLGATKFVAMHWGTFRLTDEPIGEPPVFTRAEFERVRLELERLAIPAVGETLAL
ncbi:MAG: MBL fold metallo-hydrolase [Polyangiaceae bacterium]